MNTHEPNFRHDAPLRPLRAIRARCVDCCAGSAHEVKQCAVYGCALWPYRLGKRPKNGSTLHERAHSIANGPEVDPDPDRNGACAETARARGLFR